MLQLCEQLDEGGPQGGHDVRGVESGQSAEDAEGVLPDLEDFIVEGDEEGPQVGGLGEVPVETTIEGGEDGFSDGAWEG